MGWKDVLSMVIFGIAGLLAVQLAYFMTIDYSNAGTATLLQYVAPFFIMVWLVLTGSKRSKVYHSRHHSGKISHSL